MESIVIPEARTASYARVCSVKGEDKITIGFRRKRLISLTDVVIMLRKRTLAWSLMWSGGVIALEIGLRVSL